METGGEHGSAQGARIEGKIDVVRALLESGQRINDERHERLSGDVLHLRNRVHDHAQHLQPLIGLPPRVAKLEKDATALEGERLGITKTLKIAWMTGGAGLTAFGLTMAKKAGLL